MIRIVVVEHFASLCADYASQSFRLALLGVRTGCCISCSIELLSAQVSDTTEAEQYYSC
ncbi:MAG TPA: hypothetical protein VGQ04_14780 [Chitinophagaceae bacterium]|nr:hypothetical protein [Chitinophagaceae bacterium]